MNWDDAEKGLRALLEGQSDQAEHQPLRNYLKQAVRWWLRGEDDVEDVIQEILRKLLRTLRRPGPPPEDLRRYVNRAVTNAVRDHHRKKRRQVTVVPIQNHGNGGLSIEEIPDSSSPPSRNLVADLGVLEDPGKTPEDQMAAMGRILGRILHGAAVPRDIQLYCLLRLRGLTYSQIAEVTAEKQNTINVKMLRFFKDLKKHV